MGSHNPHLSVRYVYRHGGLRGAAQILAARAGLRLGIVMGAVLYPDFVIAGETRGGVVRATDPHGHRG